jgi:hypothetical protein
VGVFCACMPGMRAFYTQVFPGKRWKENRCKRSQDYTSSGHPSSSGTVGSNGRVGSQAKRQDELELISIGSTELASRHDLAEEREVERHQHAVQNLV